MVQNPPTFSTKKKGLWTLFGPYYYVSAGRASYLGWFSASCRAEVMSQPHLSCGSHQSGAVVGREVGNPRSRTRRVGLLLARQGEMPVLQQPVQPNKPEIPWLCSFPSLALQAADFWRCQTRRLCPTPHELTENLSVAEPCAQGLPGAKTSPGFSHGHFPSLCHSCWERHQGCRKPEVPVFLISSPGAGRFLWALHGASAHPFSPGFRKRCHG